MSKSIIMSIQPAWLAKILNGEKTIEIRKTMPKCELPIDVYLYCTKGKPYITQQSNSQFTIRDTKDYTNVVNGKIVAKFTLNKVDELEFYDFWGKQVYLKDIAYSPNYLAKKAALDIDDIVDYGNDKSLYAWHIDNLVIFDKPKELNGFEKEEYYSTPGGWFPSFQSLTKAPQSWQYVYVKGE